MHSLSNTVGIMTFLCYRQITAHIIVPCLNSPQLIAVGRIFLAHMAVLKLIRTI